MCGQVLDLDSDFKFKLVVPLDLLKHIMVLTDDIP